jgi:hypothetical protein
MQLLGPYKSSLVNFHYQELLALLKQSMQAGEYSANKTFDQAAVVALQKAAQDFDQLPKPSAGQRATDDAFNRPLELLSARFAALASESSAFTARAAALISVIEKDSVLIDQLLAAANLLNWAQAQPQLNGAQDLSWDFAMGFGAVDNSSLDGVTTVDPLTSVLYSTQPALASVFDTSAKTYHAGLVPPQTATASEIKAITWSYTTVGQSETLYGPDWASLSILEDFPRVNFASSPGVEVLQPSGVSVDSTLAFSGQVSGGSLPLYVKIQQAARRKQLAITPVNANLPARNLIVDPDINNGTTTWDAGSLALGVGFGAISGKSIQYTGTGAASGFLAAGCDQIPVVPGQTYILSGYVDASHVPSGSPSWILVPNTGTLHSPVYGTAYVQAQQTAGSNGRITSTTWTCPVGVSQVVVIADTNNCTVASAQLLAFSNPQLELASSASAYTNLYSFPLPSGSSAYLETFFHTTGSANGNLQASLVFFNSSGAPVLDGLGNKLSVVLPAQPASTISTIMAGVVATPSNFPAIASAKLVISAIASTTGNWILDSYRAHAPQSLNSLQVSQDSVSVYVGTQVYFASTDFSVDGTGNILFWNIPDTTALTARFTEMFPGYQCSVNNTDWSPVVMLDPLRPYPDDTVSFLPTNIVNGQFPLTDELGVPVGLFMKILQTPVVDYLIRITTPATGVQPGPSATLTIEFGTASYMTGLSVSPFTDQPLRLLLVEAQGFTSDTRQGIYSGSVTLDRQMTFTFPRQLVGKVFLTVAQENYSLKEYTLDAPDKLRRDTLAGLQSGLPFAARRIQPAPPVFHRGAQYDFGLEHIAGVDWAYQVPGVYVSGPYRLAAVPEVIRFDASYTGSPQFYLCFRAYNAAGVQQDLQIQGIALTSGSTLVFPFVNTLNRTLVNHVDIFVKIAFRSASDIVERFVIQTDIV